MITKSSIDARLIAFAEQLEFDPERPSMPKSSYYSIIAGLISKEALVPTEHIPAIMAVLENAPKNESAMRQKLVGLLTTTAPTSTLAAGYMALCAEDDDATTGSTTSTEHTA